MPATFAGEMEKWFSWAIVSGCAALLVLALAGILPWELAGSLFIIIACGGELVQWLIERLRRPQT